MAAEEAVRRERAARSLAIEKAYVHDVYQQASDDGQVKDTPEKILKPYCYCEPNK